MTNFLFSPAAWFWHKLTKSTTVNCLACSFGANEWSEDEHIRSTQKRKIILLQYHFEYIYYFLFLPVSAHITESLGIHCIGAHSIRRHSSIIRPQINVSKIFVGMPHCWHVRWKFEFWNIWWAYVGRAAWNGPLQKDWNNNWPQSQGDTYTAYKKKPAYSFYLVSIFVSIERCIYHVHLHEMVSMNKWK